MNAKVHQDAAGNIDTTPEVSQAACERRLMKKRMWRDHKPVAFLAFEDFPPVIGTYGRNFFVFVFWRKEL